MAYLADGVFVGRSQPNYGANVNAHNPVPQHKNYDVVAGQQHHETRKTEMSGLRGQLQNIQENSPDYLKLLNRYHELESEEKAEQISVQKAIKDGPPAELNPTDQEKYKSDLAKLDQDISKTLNGDDDGKADGLIDIGKGRYLRVENPQSFTNPANCGPGMEPLPGYTIDNKVVAGPNHFNLSILGPDPDLVVGGTYEQQEVQRNKTVQMATYAGTSYESRVIPGSTRVPSDNQVTDILKGLNTNLPVGKDGVEVTKGIYRSSIPNASADQAFNHWVQNPNQVFNAGGMEIRPPITTLVNGRYMLETGGTNAPPTWLPVEITVDATTRSINIKTLDGHVLRGEQTFSFKDDGCGGTQIVQEARFQASSQLAGDLQQFLPISTGQHNAWQNAHRESYEQFNGDKNFQGIGMPYVDPLRQTIALTKQAVGQITTDPAGAADGGVDLLGDVGNLALDAGGSLARKTMGWLGLPGGNKVEKAADTAGDVVEGSVDKVGDWAKAGVDKLGLPSFSDVRDKTLDGISNTWDRIPGHGAAEKTIDKWTDKLPFNNVAKASVHAVFGAKEVELDSDAIKGIQNDPAFIKAEKTIGDEAKAEAQTDPRYGKVAFDIPLSELPALEANGGKYPLGLGGERGDMAMGDQARHFYDLSNPEIRKTYQVAGNEQTWLLRNCQLTGTAHVAQDGSITIEYTIKDKLDLSSQSGRSNAYNTVSDTLGSVWHGLIGAEMPDITANFTRPVA